MKAKEIGGFHDGFVQTIHKHINTLLGMDDMKSKNQRMKMLFMDSIIGSFTDCLINYS